MQLWQHCQTVIAIKSMECKEGAGWRMGSVESAPSTPHTPITHTHTDTHTVLCSLLSKAQRSINPVTMVYILGHPQDQASASDLR